MPDFGIFRGFNSKLFSDKLFAGQLPTQLGLIGSYEIEAIDFFNRVTTAGGSLSSTEQYAINQLVIELKNYGLWSKMKAIYPMVGASAAACAQNLKSSSFTGSFTSGWTFASTGATPNGTSAYFNSNLNTNGFSSLHFSYYSRTNNTLGRDMGNTDFANLTKTFDLILSLSGTFYNRFTTNSSISTSIANSTGFFIATEAPTLQHKAFRNNLQLGSTANFNGNYLNMDVLIGAVNGSTIYYGQKQCAFSSIGDGLTDTEASNFYTAVQAFQTSLSRQV